MGKSRLLPGGMTELDVPRPIIMDVNRIGDDVNVFRVVTDEFGEDGADERLHTAARGNSSDQPQTDRHEGLGLGLLFCVP